MSILNSHPFVGIGKLDTAGVTIGCPDTALVTRVAIEEDVALAVYWTKS